MDWKKIEPADKFVRSGYEVNPTSNGGFFVSLPRGYNDGSTMRMYATDSAAFTNSTDFLAWLASGHAVYDKEIVR